MLVDLAEQTVVLATQHAALVQVVREAHRVVGLRSVLHQSERQWPTVTGRHLPAVEGRAVREDQVHFHGADELLLLQQSVGVLQF